MSRVAAMLFAILAYAIFFATFLYLIVFVGDFSLGVRTVDVGPALRQHGVVAAFTGADVDISLPTHAVLNPAVPTTPIEG